METDNSCWLISPAFSTITQLWDDDDDDDDDDGGGDDDDDDDDNDDYAGGRGEILILCWT